MKAIERLGRIEYKAAFNRYLRRHAIRAFKQQFPNYKSYENAINNIDKVMSGTMIDDVTTSISATKIMDVFEYKKKD